MMSRPSVSAAIGSPDSAMSDITGSCTIITAMRPEAVSTSRLTEVIVTCMASRMPFAASASWVMNSVECRSWKNRMSCRIKWSNNRFWMSATIRLPARDRSTSEPKVAKPRRLKSPATAQASIRNSLNPSPSTMRLRMGLSSQAEMEVAPAPSAMRTAAIR